MKKRITAIALAFCMMMSYTGFVYADDTNKTKQEQEENNTEKVTEKPTEKQTEKQTEKVTEKPTEKQIEKVTEKPTEATTKKTEVKTEATTSATTTTTKKTTNNEKNVNESEDITIKRDSSKSLGSYVEGHALTAFDFNWSSNDSSVATVTSNGKITGKKKGECTVTATARDGNTKYTYTFNITVTSTSSSSSTSKSFTIDVDEEKDLYRYVDDEYSASKYDWKSSAERYVSVSSRGVITGEREGSATITATYDNGDDEIEYKFKITVGNDRDRDDDDDDDDVAKKTSWDIYVGTNDRVDISDILEDDPDEYDWSVDDEDIAEIDEDDGVIRGLEEGETDIEAEGDTDYTFTVYVGDDYSNDEMTIRGSVTKDIEDYLDDDADKYSFKSDRKTVATVNSRGQVTGVANGIATIICEHEDNDDEIIQIFVTVSGISKTTTTKRTTTTERTTETTTARVNQATTTVVSFNDISHRAWAIDSIKAMASKGYIVGVGANKFSPDANCKRCDFTIVLIKMLGLNDPDANDEYNDISSRDYYYNYAITALANGIESGVANNNFRPNDYITREEVMVMVYKGLNKKGVNMNTDTSVLNKFTDASSIAPENKAAVAALINRGAISGTSDTTLEPKAKITRAQMAVIMNKVDGTVN